MEGSLKEIHLGGLLRLLTLHRFTGALHLEDATQKGVIFICEGLIQGSLRSPNSQPIGQILLKKDFLTATVLGEALTRQKNDPNPRPLGHYLTTGESPALSPELFRQALTEQSSDNVIELLKMINGTFRFEDGVKGFEDFPLAMGMENLILKSFRSLPEAQASEALPPGSAIMEWAPRPNQCGLDLSLSADEWNTLLLFDGDRNLDSILQLAPSSITPASVTLYAFVSAGIIKKVRFRFPDLERICLDELGNMGLVLVRNAYQKTGVSRARMGMRELIRILNDLNKSMSMIVGPTRAEEIVDRLWEATKH
jgi:hypothetical protein